MLVYFVLNFITLQEERVLIFYETYRVNYSSKQRLKIDFIKCYDMFHNLKSLPLVM